ncbi:PRC-barrel domain-containing protein [Vreelandella populi]|uniref:PRC-barrel domain containing protein n=1 Tax=Vreelandella populi TaxID=2498858 RepID=A0A433LGB8_9GAMM|nr:PRC-barrel domain-containing protein [Halomonas populi]RUR37913.1 PRC-barrel domain containing protein [Halomonas populi]RUR48891.1 PRC-barrel domain containing protein [Halomonas populi]RUR55235.1 PRC-barrel domain containing protein [Halomonas populi]
MKRTTLAIAIAALCTGMSGGAFAENSQAEEDRPEGAMDQQQEAVNEQEGSEGKRPAAMEHGYARSSADGDEQGSNPDDLMTQQIRDIEGKSVVNQQDEEIGNIDRIVEHKESGDLYAIISIGGLWGIGDEKVALPLEDIVLEDDQLITNTTYGSDEIEASAEKYDEENYSQVDNNMTLNQAQQHPN